MAKEKRASREDVAKLAGVSGPMVSYVVNKVPNKVSEENKQRILAAMDTLNYKPSGAGRPSKDLKSAVVGILVLGLHYSIMSNYVVEAQKYLEKKGFSCQIFNTQGKAELEQLYLDNCIAREVAGLIVLPSMPLEDYASVLEKINTPIVFLCSYPEGSSRVISDDYAGGYLAAKYLIQLGHKSIAFLCPGEANESFSENRLKGYLKALSDYNIKKDDSLILKTEYQTWDRAKLVDGILKMKDRPTAIIGYCDFVAQTVMVELINRGVSVPTDISVIGFDDDEYCQLTEPTLTSINLCNDLMGQKAAELLVELITSSANTSLNGPKSCKYPASLSIRNSTAICSKSNL